MSTERQTVLREEESYLQKTITEMERQIDELENIPRYFGENITEQALDAMRVEQKLDLERSLNEPYFGRIDFHESGKPMRTPLYIGKSGVSNDANKQLLVIDWRAPIASLFYSFTGGEEISSYDSPDGRVEGRVDLKRNIVIREQSIQRVVDSYERGKDNLGVTDEFLLYRLGDNKDHRLRDIVSTIQEEQNAIIRSPMDRAIVIQGVAGSGKTTVALHRIAYLLYEHRDRIKARDMMIFAPSHMFLDYISNVLPELGVGGIQQMTFQKWVLDQLEDDLTLSEQRQLWSNWFSLGRERHLEIESSSGRVKGSLVFLEMIEDALRKYETECVPEGDFEAWSGVILHRDVIRKWITEEYRHLPINRKREKVVIRIKKWLDKQLEKVWDRTSLKELKKKSNAALKTYLKIWPELTAFGFYRQLFDARTSASILSLIPPEISKPTIVNLKKKIVSQEDLAAILFIHDYLHGVEQKQMFDHVVIDEAQDFSPFQLAVIKRRVRRNSLTILGDLAQSIHSDQGITNWQEFIGQFDEDAAFFQLQRSYRSTMEIIHFANQILVGMDIGIAPAEPVFRSGEQVRLLEVKDSERIIQLVRIVEDYQLQQVSSIAIVSRTEADSEKLYHDLSKAGLNVNLIDAKNQEYAGGISVIPIYLTKGLEFDAVIIVEVNDEHYRNNAEDAKLLYVGCTRALHHLVILYRDYKQCSALIAKIDPRYYEMK